ncbi:MAG: putative repeat protein (TIGR01451 family), partial [Bradymonadia bacterium]
APDDGGALFGEQPLEIVSGAREQRDLLVDPSGVLYEVTTASPVGGARVFLYYDEGEGEAGLGELVVDDDLASATQQGQRVPVSGFYRFDARTDAAYRIVVEPGNSGLSFPSLQLPPQEDALISASRIDVVPETNPADVDEDARTYATRIELSGPDAGVFNNHIPLDPLSDQISLVKRADRPVAYVGDIVTYTITAENRSSAELVFDSATATGGVVLVDDLPNGFRVVEGSAVATLEREGGLRPETIAIAVSGARSLRFEQTDGGTTRPLSLPAGARMTLRYFAVLGSSVEPGDTYRNTAQLLQADTEFALSGVAHVDVRVEYDPVFDQGTLLGKVYCDDNGDGRQQRGERGLPGARIYLDTGFYTDVDSDGQFHFSAIDPGLHLLKVDMHTLPVGSTLTTEETRAFNVTRGLPVGIDFGVSCPDFSVDDIDVTPGDEALAEAERRRRERYVQLQADVRTGGASLEGEALPLLGVGTSFGAGSVSDAELPSLASGVVERVEVPELLGGGDQALSEDAEGVASTPLDEGSGQDTSDVEGAVGMVSEVDAPPAPGAGPLEGEELAVVELRAGVDGTLVEPLAVSLTTNAPISGWVLEVEDARDGRTVYLREGRTWPSEGVMWNGQNDQGEPILQTGGVYVSRVRVMDEASRYAEGAPVIVRVAETRQRYLLNERLSDVEMDERRLDPAIATALRAMAPQLQATAPNAILIGAHVDDRDNERDAEAVTRSQAIAAARFMVSELGIDRERIEPEGYGVSRPIYPNVGDRTRQSNRRFDVRVVDPDSEIIVPDLPTIPTPVPRVVANRRALDVNSAGLLDELLPIPADGWIAITVQRPDGSAQGIMTQVRATEPVAQTVQRATLAQVPVTVSLATGQLEVGGTTMLLEGLSAALSVSANETEVRGARVAPALTFEHSGLPEATSWRFDVSQPGIGLVWSESGDGAVPQRFAWQGRTADGGGVGNGRHIARVSVRTASGSLITSSPASFWVGEPAVELEAAPSLVRINGELLPGATDEVRATVRSATGRRLLIDVQSGARVIMAVTVPEGFAATSSGELDLSGFRLGVAPTTPDEGTASGTNVGVAEPASVGTTSEAAGDGASGAGSPAAPAEAAPESPIEQAPPVEPPAADPEPPASPFRPATSSNPMRYLSPGSAPAVTLDLVAQASPAGFAPTSDGSEAAPMPSYDELTAFYERELAASLSTDLESELQRIANEAPAGQIDVQLPPPGVAVPSPRLPVQGTTAVGNRVLVNGTEVDVDDEGRFATVVTLPAGPSDVVVETIDVDGNRGRLAWPVEVNRSAFFLMALADTAVGTSNAEIAGSHDHNSRTTGGGALLYGQARLYFKGWVSGEEILAGQFDDIEMTAHVDTGARREFQSFTRETIQPDRDYPVFGDGSEAVSDVNTSGKVYVLLQADESHAMWGNFNSEIQGVELLRYERNLYGAQVVLDETFAEEFETELRIHVADEEEQVRQTYNYLRGTGGSIYYLQDRPVVEGSERVAVVVRDRISGIELSRTPLSRNADYSVRYSEGRIITRAPVPSVVDDTFIVGNTGTTRSVLRGNPVYIEVTYDQETTGRASDVSYGVHARETFYDLFTVGGGVVEEGDTNDGGYSLWGVEAGFGPTETTRVDVEFARSESDDLQYSYSDDGGLTFGRFRVDDTEDDSGSAILVRGRFEIADVIESERGQIWNVDAYYQETDRGFFSNGTILDQGEERYGVASRWAVNERHGLSLRHDRVETSVDDFETDELDDTVLLERQVTVAQYDYQMEPGTLTLSYQHSFVDDERIDDGYENDIVAAAIGARIMPWLRLGIEQELVIRGEDPRLIRGAQGPGSQRIEDRFITTVTTDLRLTQGLELTASERFRYSGENAATVGLRARWSDSSTVYIQQRATRRAENHGTELTTVVGGEERYGAEGNGRAYGEYHLDNGSSGQRTRAVLGFGQRWQVIDELSLDLGFERSETLSSTTPDSDQSRDTVSFGWELRLPDAIRVSGLFEARFDSGAARGAATGQCLGGAVDGTPGFCRDSVTSVGDRRQLASLLTAQWQITEDTSWFGRFDYVVTENRTLDLVEARDVEGTLGMAWRPVDYDTVDLLARYTYLGELAPYGLELDQRREERSHVFSIAPIIELPWNFQLIEKVAYRNIRLDVEGMPRVNNDLWLFINRLNYHLLATVDIGAEYRFLHQTLTDDWEHGLLFEAAYILQENVRIGLGYNFTRFTEDELGDFDRNASGVFFRVTAHY